jgi:hypothetical protein
MAFPNDLSDVVVFKVHPAIGVARVTMNDDYYVFGRDPGNYSSAGRHTLGRHGFRYLCRSFIGRCQRGKTGWITADFR